MGEDKLVEDLMRFSESALKEVWDTPEEDEAWSYLMETEEQYTTVEEYVRDNRVQLHKFPDCSLYFVYNKVTRTVAAYHHLESLVEDFLFEVSLGGRLYLNEIYQEFILQIYIEHKGKVHEAPNFRRL